MSAAVEEQKPVVPVETSTVEPTPAPVVADKPVEAAEPTVEEPAKTEEPAAPAEEKKEAKPAEPILSGALGYKAPGLKNAFRFSKKHFWFTEEPVSTEGLAHYLRGEKPEVAHPTAAWSSKTGKGLVYFVKHAEQTDSPAGVLNLSEATEVTKDGFTAFFVKIAGHKHTFEAQTPKERDGWFASFEKAFAEAKELKEEIVNSEEYKEVKATLAKPTALAHHTAKESTPKKSSDAAPKLAEAESSTAAETPARTGSSSSSSDDEEKKKKKASKSKSRSVSRGKRASIFGNFLGKKEKAEEKVEEKKEEKKEETEAKKEETPAAEPAPVVAAPVIVEELPKPVAEEAKTEETPVVAEASAPAEEKKVEEPKPKPTKRASIFGGFIKGLKSPTKEKDESEVVPAPPAKETETTAVAPKVEETPAPAAETPVATTEATTEAPKEEVKPTTPHKEKEHFSFGKFLGAAKEKAKSPVHEKAPEPKAEEPVKKEEPVAPVAPVEPVAEAPKEEKKEEETTPTTKKRGSIFEKYGEKGLGLLRNASKAGRSKKEDKATPATAKVEETPEPKEEKVEEPKPVEKKEETPIADAETKAIGDVVPEAVTVGEAPKSTTQVSATA